MNIKRKLILVFLFPFVFSYGQHNKFKQGVSYYEQENYSAAQSIFENINSDEALFLSAECSKILFLDDAKYKFYKHLLEYPNSSLRSRSNLGLSQIFYRENNYKKTIEHYLEVADNDFTYEHIFKLGYSYFVLDFFEEASYYFSQLLNKESKYASVAQYYYSHIAYRQGFYKRALSGFNKLKFSEKFSNIIPYYITQIYFFQKRYQELIDYTQLIIDNVISSRRSEVHRLIAESHYHLANYTKSVYHFEIFISETENLKTIDYFQLGHAYFNVNDYLNTIKYLEKVSSNEENIQQLVAYYLGASYIKLEYKNYALNSFKKASEYDSNPTLQEDALFNYIKLSFELNSPFDNTVKLINRYLDTYEDSEKKNHIESLMIQAWQGKFEYERTYIALKEKSFLSLEDQIHFQKVSFFLGIKSYNEEDFTSAILLFNESNKYPSNEIIYFMSIFWLADCYYQLQDYQEAIIKYNLLSNHTNEAINYYQDLRKYNQAYCYFYLKKYRESNQFFRNYLKNSNDSMRMNDACLRLGDGLLIENEFLLASEYYKKAIQFNLFDVDYALYNQSLCFGLLNQSRNKLNSLKELIKSYRSSIYYDDALLSLANHYSENSSFSLSISYYDSLLDYTSNYEMQAKAYLSKGMLYLRNKQLNNAIEMFSIVLQQYNESRYFKESISGLQAAYTNLGKIEKYLEIINDLPQINISKLQKDSLTYQAAFSKFVEGDFKTANKVFQNYLTNFPNGIFSHTVHFYSAKTAISLKDTSSALMHYNFLVESNHQMYLEKSLVFLSRYYYNRNDFPNGNMYYMGLEKIASTNSIKREAILRLMYLNESKNLRVAVDYAKKVLDLEKVDSWQLTKAYIIIARNDFEEGNYYRAKKSFKKIISLSENDEAAEASYMLIYLTYLEEDYHKIEGMVFQIAEKYNNNHFLAKSFLILVEVYKLQEKRFQAKVTLESIIDSNIDEEIVSQARKKWEEIIQEEKEDINTPAINEQSYIDILEEDIDYELIFNEDTIE